MRQSDNTMQPLEGASGLLEEIAQQGLEKQTAIRILRQCCYFSVSINKINASKEPLSVSCNILPEHLTDPDFVEEIKRNYEAFGSPAITLELLEQETIPPEQELIYQQLRYLKTSGLGLHLDDFGRYFEPDMHRLKHLNGIADGLKLDKSFLNKEPAQQLEMLATISEYFHERVTFEGVENNTHIACCEKARAYFPGSTIALQGWHADLGKALCGDLQLFRLEKGWGEPLAL